MRCCRAMYQRLLCPFSPRLAATPAAAPMAICKMHLLRNQQVRICRHMRGRCFMPCGRARPHAGEGGQQVQYCDSQSLASSWNDGG